MVLRLAEDLLRSPMATILRLARLLGFGFSSPGHCPLRKTAGASTMHLPLDGTMFPDLAARTCRLASPRSWAASNSQPERRSAHVDAGDRHRQTSS